mmetsp:Transcript_22961/g.58686  ORF Transcript_22961/g.58686 Transcript_22961/m.58686 type:complete len:319 (+) Transcript_22961:1055-2011(+)
MCRASWWWCPALCSLWARTAWPTATPRQATHRARAVRWSWATTARRATAARASAAATATRGWTWARTARRRTTPTASPPARAPTSTQAPAAAPRATRSTAWWLAGLTRASTWARASAWRATARTCFVASAASSTPRASSAKTRALRRRPPSRRLRPGPLAVAAAARAATRREIGVRAALRPAPSTSLEGHRCLATRQAVGRGRLLSHCHAPLLRRLLLVTHQGRRQQMAPWVARMSRLVTGWTAPVLAVAARPRRASRPRACPLCHCLLHLGSSRSSPPGAAASSRRLPRTAAAAAPAARAWGHGRATLLPRCCSRCR